MSDDRRYRLYQINAFTRSPFSGNPAGVVPAAQGLSDQEMQAIARELGNPESAFVLPADGDDHDVRVRFFTPTTEVPSCGHATVAAHYVRALEQGVNGGVRVLQKIGAGILAVEIEEEGDGDYLVIMTQAPPRFGMSLDGERLAELRRALGLREDDLCDLPVQVVDTGHPKLVVPLRDAATLDALTPNHEALRRLSGNLPYSGVFLFALADPDDDVLTRARMFAPEIGIPEDPVTGNGNGPLGAYLVHHRIVPHDGVRLHFGSRQGEAMGRPGVARVWVDIEDGAPTRVRVGGNAVVVFRGELRLTVPK